MMTGVEGKVAVVTGSAGGIGGAVARAFGDAGAEVIGLDREQADLSRPDEVASFFAELDRLDVLFNGAGISGRSLGDGPVEECTIEGWNAVLANNLTSVFLCCKYAIPLLRAAGGGAIVNLSSAMALTAGDEDFATHAYQVSKAGILTLTRALAFHYGRDGIRVNAVVPGLIATPMSLRAQSDPGIVSRLPELHPLTGDFGTPEDVAGAALYLATAPFVTGAILTVDAGWTLRGADLR
jgi:NAD(P)-dependent dehydrogenase (short-subunit alcohol dehydrogenase family)